MKIKFLPYSLVLIFTMIFFSSCSNYKEALKILPNELAQADECKNNNKNFELDCYDLISYKNSFAQLRLGINSQTKGNYDEAFQRYNLAKEKGNFYANSLIADIYKKGYKKAKDEDVVFDLLEDVKEVDPIAAYKLSFYYMNKKEYKKAMKLLDFAAKNDLKKAQYELYKIYSNGEKVPLDIEKSKFWFEKYENNENDFISKIYGL